MAPDRRAFARVARRRAWPLRLEPFRPRVAFAAPMPPARTGIAPYARTVLDGLQRIGFSGENRIDVLWPIERKHELRIHDYHLGVYHLGNNVEFHRQIYRWAVLHPGLVVLHDIALDDFVRGMIGQGEPLGLRAKREALALVAEGRVTLPDALASEPLRVPWCADLARHSLGIIVHSEFCRRYLLDLGCRTPVFVVAHPLPEHEADVRRADARGREIRAALSLRPDDTLIVAPGDLNESKGLGPLLSAVDRLDRGRRVRVGLVGRRGLYDVERLVARSPASAVTTVATEVTDDDFRGWLSAADVVIDLRDPHRGEVSGSLMRAMQFGRPSIVSGIGTYNDIPADAVVRVAPGPPDPDELTAALRGLVDEPELRRAIGEHAREHLLSRTANDATARGYAEAIEGTLALATDQGRRALSRWSRALLDLGYGEEHLARGLGLAYARALEDFKHSP